MQLPPRFDSTETFDPLARRYEEVLNGALAPTGEDAGFYAWERIAFLRGLGLFGHCAPASILDFGCGTGGAFAALAAHFPGAHIHGVDPSRASLEVARGRWAEEAVSLWAPEELGREVFHWLVVCNGVFHHIPRGERAAALEYIYERLHGEGWFAFFENNPWNPGTRWLMNRCPFDREAEPISPRGAARMLRRAGFEVVLAHSLFYFPRHFRKLRCLEPALGHLPLGGQYLVLARKGAPRSLERRPFSLVAADLLGQAQMVPGWECML
jgi:SAM-dependent methyltransferase